MPSEDTAIAESGGTTGTTGTSEGTTFGGPNECGGSADCEAGYCVAPYDAGAGMGTAGMGTAVCVPECVPVDALDRWCIDDGSCCDGLSCDDRDGFCLAPAASSDETIGESWSTDESTSGSGGATSSGSSGGSEGSSSSSG